jgi:hypothetical protein
MTGCFGLNMTEIFELNMAEERAIVIGLGMTEIFVLNMANA